MTLDYDLFSELYGTYNEYNGTESRNIYQTF